MILTFETFIIASGDQHYIDTIERKLNEFFGLNYPDTIYQGDAELFISDSIASHDITNQVISHLISEGINHLDVPDTIKDILMDSIYCNSIDSGLSIDVTPDRFPEEYIDLIQSFKDIF